MGFKSKFDMLQAMPDKKKENLISALYIGLIFVMLAVLYFINDRSNLWNSFNHFLNNFVLATVPGTGCSITSSRKPSSLHLAVQGSISVLPGLRHN